MQGKELLTGYLEFESQEVAENALQTHRFFTMIVNKTSYLCRGLPCDNDIMQRKENQIVVKGLPEDTTQQKFYKMVSIAGDVFSSKCNMVPSGPAQ